MAESLTRQDEANPVVWLTTCLRSSPTILARKSFFGHIINPILTKVVPSRWPYPFFKDLNFVSRHKNAKKFSQYSATLASRWVDNA